MSTSWSIAQYRDRITGVPRLGILNGAMRALPENWPTTSALLFDAWEEWEPQLRALDVSSLELADGELVAPITYPRKVLCAGANYYDHAAEMGTATPDPGEKPFFFMKPPTTTVIGSGADIVVEDAANAGLDWEVELAVVISKRCKNVAVEDFASVVAGYTVSNDISARGRFPRANAVMAPFAWDWLNHKGLDDSCPIGPGIVPAWLVGDPQNLGLRLWVNGVVKQDSSTSDMVIGVAQLVSAASHAVTLEPGDLILTGTPAGVGMPRKDFLSVGDVIVAEIDGLGRLENTIAGA